MRALLLGLLLWQAGSEAGDGAKPEARHFLYRRAVAISGDRASGQACAPLDGAVYAHGAEALNDVRLFGEGAREVPYAITLSQAAEEESAPARVMNVGKRGGGIVFDLAMPDRLYTDVSLDLAGRDFIATAEVTGANALDRKPTSLGSFTLFDLSGQHLARSTVLPLAESRYAVLHVAMHVSAAPGAAVPWSEVAVRGATVPPSREAQTVYTAVAETRAIAEQGRKTVASFRLPRYVPVERVSFAVAAGFTGNFSRAVTVTAEPEGRDQAGPFPVETVRGAIERVKLTSAGRAIEQAQLSVPATLGSNLEGDAKVKVEVENGDDAPLPLTAVQLEMRQRKVCFPVAGAGSGLTLFYGDGSLEAPRYDFARVLSLGRDVGVARLGPEERNPGYEGRAAAGRSLTERHPELLWVALLGVVCVLAVVALHSARRVRG